MDDINILGTDATIIAGLLILMTLVSFKVERSKSGTSFSDEMSEEDKKRSFKKNKKLAGNTLAAVLEDLLGNEMRKERRSGNLIVFGIPYGGVIVTDMVTVIRCS